MSEANSALDACNTQIATLGPAKIKSPLMDILPNSGFERYSEEYRRVRIDPYHLPGSEPELAPPSFERAGPRKNIYFDPTKLKVAVVCCGGMCPGLNNLVRSMVLQLHHLYGVRNIVGVRYGLQGFIPSYGHELMDLTPEVVMGVHGRGGSFLGMSRGPQPVEEVVDALERLNIGLLFAIGGDGTLHASKVINDEIAKRGMKIAVVAIPKTIDNDISYVEMSFGFQSAVEAATEAILSAHNEATGAPNGIGLVKLMGRNSGFVATHATLALTDVNFCLIPEIDFDLQGPDGLLAALQRRLESRGHGVIVAAEGAGQKFFTGESAEADASGNPRLSDIGTYLKQRINAHFNDQGIAVNLKYIDPSYMIRSRPANANDRIYTGFLGHHAVHAGMSGKTDMLVSLWNSHYVHVPLSMAISKRRTVDPLGGLWRGVIEATGQCSLVNQV